MEVISVESLHPLRQFRFVTMRIEKLSYHNHVTGWRLAPMEFGDINLLVGVSGVGKTEIINAIRSLKQIAFGSLWPNNSLNGVEWDVAFFIPPDLRYRWCGKFDVVNNEEYTIDELGNKKYSRIKQNANKIETEELYLNDKCIVVRSSNGLIFQEEKMPRIDSSKSAIGIFNEEDKIAPIFKGLLSILDSKTQKSDRWTGSSISESKTDNFSLSEIFRKNITLVDILGLLWINNTKIFEKIKFAFVEIFPQVEDLRIITTQTRYQFMPDESESILIFSLELKEFGVENWITQSHVSTGMLKTLAHIVEIYLLEKGSILLIDEFENSLGVNCIDVVSDLLSDRQDIQFILTSHHPYIINKIPMQYWKIITRKGSVVTANNATDYRQLSGSKHKVFTQLLNLPAYTEGIEVG